MNSLGRNKIIEIYRLVFTILIVFSHLRLLGNTSIFISAWLGVDFFFILSGYLMSKNIYSLEAPSNLLGQETIQFLYHKFKNIYPVFIFAFIAEILMEKTIGLNTGSFIYKVWDLTFLRMTGLRGNYFDMAVGASWYLHALFLSLFILYPFARKFTDMYHYVLAPITSILIMGYMSNVYGHLCFALHFSNGVCLGLLRAIADLCLGAITFIIVNKCYLSFDKSSLLQKCNKYCIFFFMHLLSLAIILWIMITFKKSQMNFICTFFSMILIITGFLDRCFISKIIFDKLNVKWIAKFSLAIYLNHMIWIRLLIKLAPPLTLTEKTMAVWILTIATAYFCLSTLSFFQSLYQFLGLKYKKTNISSMEK